MEINIFDIIAVVAAIVVIILVIRFIKKSWSVIITALIILVLGFYLFVWGFSRNDRFVLYSLQENYCEQEKDSVKCNCIILPLINDLEEHYTKEEIENFSKNAFDGSKALAKTIKNNVRDIKSCLQKKESEHLWDEFKKELMQNSVKGMKKSLQLELENIGDQE